MSIPGINSNQVANFMITSIKLNIVPSEAISESLLQQFAELAKASGATPEEKLAELIEKEVKREQQVQNPSENEGEEISKI